MSQQQLEQIIREFVAERHDGGEVGVIELRVLRPGGGLLDLIDVEPAAATDPAAA
jgi:hypothetical protein